jgi:hypothetical protein
MTDPDEALNTLGYTDLTQWALDHGFYRDEQRSLWIDGLGHHILPEDMHDMIISEARFVEDLEHGDD